MALTVNTNMASMNALTNLDRTSRSLGGTFERISSGLRINKSADDAAGMAVAENLSAAFGSSRVAMRNTNDGISVIQTAEGAADEVVNIVKRMRELAVQSSSETLNNDERAYIQEEYESLTSEVDRIAQSTEFNGLALSNGGTTQLDVQVGINNTANDRITMDLGDMRGTVLGVDVLSIDMSTATGAQSAIDTLDTALDLVNGYRSDFGATQNRLDSAMSNLETYSQTLASAESQIRDADFAFETAEMAKQQIMQQAGISILSQANTVNQGVLSLL
jgi:flagellin